MADCHICKGKLKTGNGPTYCPSCEPFTDEEKAKVWFWLCVCGMKVNKYNGKCPCCGEKKPTEEKKDES